MICGPSEVSFHEKFFWYRAEKATASISLEAGLDAGDSLRVPFDKLVSSTHIDSSSFELRLRLEGQESEGVTCFIFRLQDPTHLSAWTKRLTAALIPSVLLTMLPADIWKLITAYLDLPAWRAMRASCSRTRELVRGETERLAAAADGVVWAFSVDHPFMGTTEVRAITAEKTEEGPHPIFPGLYIRTGSLSWEYADFPVFTKSSMGPLKRPFVFPLTEAFSGLSVALDVTELRTYDTFKLGVECKVLHPQSRWTILTSEEFESLLQKDLKKRIVIDDRVSIASDNVVKGVLTGDVENGHFEGFFSAGFAPGCYKIVYSIMVQQYGRVRCYDLQSAATLQVNIPESWKSFKLTGYSKEWLIFDHDDDVIVTDSVFLCFSDAPAKVVSFDKPQKLSGEKLERESVTCNTLRRQARGSSCVWIFRPRKTWASFSSALICCMEARPLCLPSRILMFPFQSIRRRYSRNKRPSFFLFFFFFFFFFSLLFHLVKEERSLMLLPKLRSDSDTLVRPICTSPSPSTTGSHLMSSTPTRSRFHVLELMST